MSSVDPSSTTTSSRPSTSWSSTAETAHVTTSGAVEGAEHHGAEGFGVHCGKVERRMASSSNAERRSSESWSPRAATSPRSSTRIRSHIESVVIRWATITMVWSPWSDSRVSLIRCSDERVERARRLVEKEQIRVGEQGSRDADALDLSSGERARHEHGLVAIGHRDDLVVHVGEPRRSLDERIVASTQEGDVLGHRPAEEPPLLRYERGRVRTSSERHLRCGLAVDSQLATDRLAQPKQQLQEGRLAGAGQSDHARRSRRARTRPRHRAAPAVRRCS